jgi:hypothetical protein
MLVGEYLNEEESFRGGYSSSLNILTRFLSILELTRPLIGYQVSAGLFFIPERSVKGNGISTMSPLFIYISPLGRLQNKALPLPLKI